MINIKRLDICARIYAYVRVKGTSTFLDNGMSKLYKRTFFEFAHH